MRGHGHAGGLGLVREGADFQDLPSKGGQGGPDHGIGVGTLGRPQVEHQVGAFQHGAHAGHTQAFHGVFGVPQARSVVKTQGQAPPLAAHLQHIPGGTWNLGDDGPILPGEGVEEGAFPGIGSAHQGQPKAVLQVPGGPGPGLFHVESVPDRAQINCQGVDIKTDTFVFAVIHGGLGPGHPGGQGPAGLGDPIRKGADPRLGQADLGVGFRGHQVPQGLGLQQTLLAVQKGPAGELPRFRQTDPQGAEVRHQAPHQQGVPVELEFHQVLAGIAGGGREEQHQRPFAEAVPAEGPQ